MVLNLSCPAVSHICNFTSFPFRLSDLIIAYLLKPKVNPNSGQIALLELIIREPPKNRTLSDRTIADDDDFKEIVVFFDHMIYNSI